MNNVLTNTSDIEIVTDHVVFVPFKSIALNGPIYIRSRVNKYSNHYCIVSEV